jgi:hypothetical protein
LNLWKVIFRAWFYFRQGYNLYLAFVIGFASNIVVLFKLGISGNKYLEWLFPSLTVFIIVGLVVAIPAGILTGLSHMKRTAAFAADASVQIEANPYMYKVIPGKERDVFLPLWVLTAKSLARMLEQQKTMTMEERKELQAILDKADALLEGQYIGLPKHLGVRQFPVTEGDK